MLSGPDSDHTPNGEFYMYIEATGNTGRGNSAVLDYNFVNPVNGGCFSLYYHMYGANMGSLTIGSTGTDGTYKDLWKKSGNQGKLWIHAFVPIAEETRKVLALLSFQMWLRNSCWN